MKTMARCLQMKTRASNMTERLGRVNSYDPEARRPKVGSVWVWELDLLPARALVLVTEVMWNGEEWWVTTESLLGNQGPHHNDLSRFWEACVPVTDTTMAVMHNSEAGQERKP
jgi:hypothetical protein